MRIIKEEIEPRCEYCRHGAAAGKDIVVCVKRGVTHAGFSCSSFRYDPTKREPEHREKINPQRYAEGSFDL